jgi:hypothetical protein
MPQFVIFKTFNVAIDLSRKSKLLMPAGPKALSLKFNYSIYFSSIDLAKASKLPGSSYSFLPTNKSLKLTFVNLEVYFFIKLAK